MEQGTKDTLSRIFMDFATWAFTRSKKIIQKSDQYAGFYEELMEEFSMLDYNINKSNFSKQVKLLVVIGKCFHYALVQKEARNVIIEDKYLK